MKYLSLIFSYILKTKESNKEGESRIKKKILAHVSIYDI